MNSLHFNNNDQKFMALASSVRMEIAGQPVPDFLDFSIHQKMPGLQEFRVTCRMDTFEEPDDFVINQSKKFIGAVMVIEVDAEIPDGKWNSPGLFFKGIIHSVKAVKSDLSNEDTIVLLGSSPDFLLCDHRGCRSFENKTLSQIVSDVLKPYPRDVLNVQINPSYTEPIPYCVQYRENSFEFLQRLAARYGEWMYYNGKELVFGSPSTETEDLVLGKDLNTLDFSIKMKAPAFKYVTYDYLNANIVQTRTDPNTGKNQQNELGKYTFEQSGKRFNSDVIQYYPHINAKDEGYLKAQERAVEVEASAIALGMSGIEATGENMSLKPGKKINVIALKSERTGEINYGKYLVTTVEHYCNNLMNYENRFTAVPADATIPAFANPEAVPRSEPQSAIVKDNKDPEKLGRVRVNFFWQAGNQMSPWIRAVNPYSANERGFYFIPEIEDEVLVGFESGDAEKPYIIGSLYHGKNKPHNTWPNNNNSFKGIVTKSKLRIEFDDEKKITTIDTPAGNKIVVSDNEKSILLNDQNKNKVELSPDGIVLESMKDIKITSQSNIKIEGTSGIEISSPADIKVEGTSGIKISSTADVKVDGLNINQTADISFVAKANASAELSASGQTTVKGATVMIN
jgi:Rhs element Vgr protein